METVPQSSTGHDLEHDRDDQGDSTVSTDIETEAATMAHIIRSAAAWWQLAADSLEDGRLEDGRLEDAARFAHLGHIGTHDMRARTAALTGEPVTD